MSSIGRKPFQFRQRGHYRPRPESNRMRNSRCPHNSLIARDALFTIAETYRSDLNQPEKARRTYREFLARYAVQEAGGRDHLEYWIPAEDLSAFNAAIVGKIEVTAEFSAESR